MQSTDVIIKPLITEKSNHQANVRNTYTFQVHTKASKPQIRKAIEEIYGVKVVDVRTIVRKGKARRNRAGYSHGPDIKRAMVTLQEDTKIELF